MGNEGIRTSIFKPAEVASTPFRRGIKELERRGHTITPDETLPGLVHVSGLGELTMGQVASFDPRRS